jgi:hypothetical protein
MTTSTTWYDLTETFGVLELHEELTAPGPALELHVIRSPSRTCACWVSDDGRMVWWVPVGQA